jgi:hypothetical protein
VWEHHGEVLPNPNVEEEENNDWVGGDATHDMLDSLRPELNCFHYSPCPFALSGPLPRFPVVSATANILGGNSRCP